MNVILPLLCAFSTLSNVNTNISTKGIESTSYTKDTFISTFDKFNVYSFDFLSFSNQVLNYFQSHDNTISYSIYNGDTLISTYTFDFVYPTTLGYLSTPNGSYTYNVPLCYSATNSTGGYFNFFQLGFTSQTFYSTSNYDRYTYLHSTIDNQLLGSYTRLFYFNPLSSGTSNCYLNYIGNFSIYDDVNIRSAYTGKSEYYSTIPLDSKLIFRSSSSIGCGIYSVQDSNYFAIGSKNYGSTGYHLRSTSTCNFIDLLESYYYSSISLVDNVSDIYNSTTNNQSNIGLRCSAADFTGSGIFFVDENYTYNVNLVYYNNNYLFYDSTLNTYTQYLYIYPYSFINFPTSQPYFSGYAIKPSNIYLDTLYLDNYGYYFRIDSTKVSTINYYINIIDNNLSYHFNLNVISERGYTYYDNTGNTLYTYILATLDTPFYMVWDFFNFNILGFNLTPILLGLLLSSLFVFVLRLIVGGFGNVFHSIDTIESGHYRRSKRRDYYNGNANINIKQSTSSFDKSTGVKTTKSINSSRRIK